MQEPYLTIIRSLEEQGFNGDILEDNESRARYSTDESIFSVMPELVIVPKTALDVAKAVRVVKAHATDKQPMSLTPRAAGTGLAGGSLNDSIIIDTTTYLTSHSCPREQGDDVLLHAEPGSYFRDIEKTLRGMVREIPVYPASKDICCIGGMIGNNAAGATSLTYGHFAEFVVSVDVVLQDGVTYTLRPWTWDVLQEVLSYDNELSRIARAVFELIEANEELIRNAKPETKKNSAGYALWDVISTTVWEFKNGNGTFDLTRLISGSQGTLGIITRATLRTIPIEEEQRLIIVPIFDLNEAGSIITNLLSYEPYTLELFDDKTFELALKNPSFFADRIDGMTYPKVLDTLYRTYFERFGKTIPSFIILASFTRDISEEEMCTMTDTINGAHRCVSFAADDRLEAEMYWQVRRASYSLSKLQDPSKRPAAFLEDMIIPPENLGTFFADIQALFKKYGVESAVHGHGGNGHLHFYPLMDFTDPETPDKVLAMSEEFFNTAIKHGGGICGEHNDGIIRTPYLDKMFTPEVLQLFRDVECIFDPHDIFNPGKKVNAKFDIQKTMRKTN